MNADHATPSPRSPDGDSREPFSRRHFLRGVAASAGAAAAVSEEGLLAAPRTPPPLQSDGRSGPGPVAVVLDVNGKKRTLKVEPRVTLLDALRDHVDVTTGAFIDLTGSKRVCDRGSCGACTMMMDGKTVYSCTVLAIEAQGKKISTVEDIAGEDGLHPVQEAFVECDGLMCGFCTSGFIVSSKDLLDRIPQPSLAEIKSALNGNICRCGTYNRVFEAVQLASTRMKGG